MIFKQSVIFEKSQVMIKKIIHTLLFLFVIVNSFAQLHVSDITFRYTCFEKKIPEILSDFEQQTNYRFTYNSAIFNNTSSVTIPSKYYTFEQLLHLTLGNQFSYKILGNQILISEIQNSTSDKKVPPKRTPIVEENKAEYTIIYDTIQVYDTVKIEKIVYKTVVDTQKVIVKSVSPKTPSKRLVHSMLDVSFFTGVSSTLPFTMRSISADYKELLKNSEQASLNNSTSLMALYRTKKLLVGAGINYSNVGYETKFETKSYTDNPSTMFSDTLWYWKYSKLFTYYKFVGGDSIAIDVFDSTYTYRLVENPQKVEHNNTAASKLSIHYLSVPCLIGYRFPMYKSWSIEPFVLASLQILTVRNGSTLSPQQQQLWLKSIPFRRVTYSVGGGCLVNYTISEQFIVSLKASLAFYPSIYKSSYLAAQKALLCGSLEWGFAYRIPFK